MTTSSLIPHDPEVVRPVELHHGLELALLRDVRFDGSQGLNRCPALPKIFDSNSHPINTDIAAVAIWLERAANPHTRRQYRKEIERFILWCVFILRRPMSSVGVSDVQKYRAFLARPHFDWIGPRKPRGPDWRPFEGPLAPSSIRQAMVIIGDCFSWLTKVRYLDFNVFDSDLTGVRQNREGVHTERHIPASALTWLYVWLTELPATRKHDRWRFTERFMISTGLREAELASARMADLFLHISRSGEYMWFLKVKGKGDKIRNVPLHDIDIISRYRESMGLPGAPIPGDQTPLWLPLRGLHNATPGAIYSDVKMMLREAAKALREKSTTADHASEAVAMRADADILEAASPHWLRHSFGTMAVQEMPLQIVQLVLGHSSINTTMVYVTTELEDAWRALSRAHRTTQPVELEQTGSSEAQSLASGRQL